MLVCKKKITKINIIHFFTNCLWYIGVITHIIYTLYKVYTIIESNATMNITNLFSSINPKEVIKNLPDALLVIENDGRIVWANNKASVIFEMSISHLKGLNFNEIVADGLELAEKSYSRRTSMVTGAFSIEGKEFFVEINAKKYIDQFFITIRDVTAMTNVLVTAERTGRLNKEKNIMFVKLSNEIKSPLQSIIGFSQALLDGLGGEINDKQEKYIKIINKNSSELLNFMEKFIEFSQAESSLFKSENQPFDITNLIQTVVKNTENLLFGKNVVLTYDFEELEKRVINGDENAVKVILSNVLETSAKMTDSGSIAVKISTLSEDNLHANLQKSADSYIHITVSDTGMGLAANEIEGIFEPYTQLDKANKKAIVRSIALGSAYTLVKRLGGTIWVESEVMKGSVFNIILPKGV